MRGDDAVGERDLKGASIQVGRIARVVTGASDIHSSDDAIGPSDHVGTGCTVRERHMRDAREEHDEPRRRQERKLTDSIYRTGEHGSAWLDTSNSSSRLTAGEAHCGHRLRNAGAGRYTSRLPDR